MLASRVRPDRISSPITSIAAVGLGIASSFGHTDVLHDFDPEFLKNSGGAGVTFRED